MSSSRSKGYGLIRGIVTYQTNIERLQAKHTDSRYHLPRFEVRDGELLFGYHDGSRDVVEIKTEPTARSLRRQRGGPFQGFILRGRLLELVTAAVLHLTDHKITPGIRSFGLRVAVNNPDLCWINIDHDGVHVYVEKSGSRIGLRIMVSCGPLWQEYDLNAEQTETLIDRLSEASQWPVTLHSPSYRNGGS